MSENANIPFGGGLANPSGETSGGVQPSDLKPLTFVCPKYNGITGVLEYLVLITKTIFSRFVVFKYRNEVIGSYQPLDDTSPLAEEIVIPEEVYILRRPDMSSPFTSDEFVTCMNEMTSGHSVSVQFQRGGYAEAKLIQVRTDGALVFSRCGSDIITTYTVAPGQVHSITMEVNQFPHPDAELTIRAGGIDYNYLPTGNSITINIDSAYSGPYVAKGGASVATLNATIPGLQPGWCYSLTDSGTLTTGNISVNINDLVCWNGTVWYKITSQYIIDRLLSGISENLLYAVLDADRKIVFAINNEGDPFCSELTEYWFGQHWDRENDTHWKEAGHPLFSVLDSAGNVIFGINPDGTLCLIEQVIDPVIDYFTKDIPNLLFCILDNAGNIIFSIDKFGRYSIDDQVSECIDNYFDTESPVSFAIVDKDNKVLLSFSRDGKISSIPLDEYFDAKLSELDLLNKDYVDEQVDNERTRAEGVEQELREAIDGIEPTVVVGGSNNPDEEFLTSVSNKLTFKNISNLVNSKNVIYLHKLDVPQDVIIQTNTTYIIKFTHDLGGTDLTMPSGCKLRFEGGCLYNGNIIGQDTFIESTEHKCFGVGLTFSGTFNVPVIEAEYFVDAASVNTLKKVETLLSDTHYNKVIINAGHTYTFEPVHDGSWQVPPDTLLNLKSNTDLRIDGTLSVVPNGFTHYGVVCARGISNVKIEGNGTISGDSDTHDYSTITSTHEWCHAIMVINDSECVIIEGLHIENMPGDGIGIDGSKNPSDGTELCVKKVIVENVNISHCGRQGISIGAVDGCFIRNCEMSDIYRTPPKAAIDIEPWTSIRAKNIVIENIKFNGVFGIDVVQADNVSISNVISIGTRLLSLNDVSNVFVNNCRIEDIIAPKAIIEVFGSVNDSSMRNVFCDSEYPTTADLSGLHINPTVQLGANNTVTAGPAAGSTRIYNNQYQFFDGSNWVNT